MREAISFIERLSIHFGLGADVRFTAAFSDGQKLYAVRYATDAVAPTLYASPMGKGYCLVSEPLNNDVELDEIPDSARRDGQRNGTSRLRPSGRKRGRRRDTGSGYPCLMRSAISSTSLPPPLPWTDPASDRRRRG